MYSLNEVLQGKGPEILAEVRRFGAKVGVGVGVVVRLGSWFAAEAHVLPGCVVKLVVVLGLGVVLWLGAVVWLGSVVWLAVVVCLESWFAAEAHVVLGGVVCLGSG